MSTIPALNLKKLADDLDTLRRELQTTVNHKDYRHLRKIERWGRACSLAGFLTAWVPFNPVSALLISQGKLTRWTIMAHHTLHRGYDQVPGTPERYTSRAFSRGRRRWIDWFDWILPAAWDHEHNVMHHYRLGEKQDPDMVEINLEWLRNWRGPRVVKIAVIFLVAVSWKFSYYAANTLVEWHAREKRPDAVPASIYSWQVWQPFSPIGRILWGQCLLPYALWNFVALPFLFLPFGAPVAWAVFFNMLLAEGITNLHSFAIIVTNHSGDDLFAFDKKAIGKGEFYLRQITGSTNFRTGGDWNDFWHGWLNYQIEHHLWPDLTMLQYRKAQPAVQAICARHGIPYTQGPVWRRVIKTLNIMSGRDSMQRASLPSEPNFGLEPYDRKD